MYMEIIEYTMHTARCMLPTSWVWKSAHISIASPTENRLLGIPAAVCLDRMGAAAIANCREKLGWPDTVSRSSAMSDQLLVFVDIYQYTESIHVYSQMSTRT